MMIRRKFFELTRRAARSFNVAACTLALASCATVTRIPYTQQEQTAAVIPGIPGARIWADDPAIATVRRSVVSRVPAKQPVVLALSGGGADCAVRIPRCGLRRNPQERVYHRRDGQLAAIGGIGGTVRHGSLQDATPARLDRETCGWLHARGNRTRAPGGTSPLYRDDQSRCTAHRDLGYGRDCWQRRPGGARSIPQRFDRVGEHSGRVLAHAHRSRSGWTTFRRNARRWRRDDECTHPARGLAGVRHPGLSAGCPAEGLCRDEQQACAGLRSREGLDAANRAAIV